MQYFENVSYVRVRDEICTLAYSCTQQCGNLREIAVLSEKYVPFFCQKASESTQNPGIGQYHLYNLVKRPMGNHSVIREYIKGFICGFSIVLMDFNRSIRPNTARIGGET